jgi:MFS family permease
MVGLGETYFPAYFLALGMSDFKIGLLATVPYLLGSLYQMLTPWGVRQLQSFRRWVVLNASVQATSLFIMGWLTWYNQAQFWNVLLLVSFYWGGGLATSPVWNTWMEFLVPSRIRAKFLSRRMRVCQISLLVSVTLAGFLIEDATRRSGPIACFAALLIGAALSRFFSSVMLNRKSEQKDWVDAVHPPQKKGPRIKSHAWSIARSTVPFFVTMQFAVYISAPYFAPFILRVMGLDCTQYMFLIVLGYVGRIMTLNWAGRVAQKWGTGWLLLIGGIGMIPLSGLWVFHHSFVFLCVLQVVGGAAWAWYELAVSLVLIEKITGPGRVSVLAWFNTFNGVAMVTGMLIGGAIIQYWDGNEWAFIAIFLLSSSVRLLTFGLFPRRLFQADQAPEFIEPPIPIDRPRID